ncbi:MAG TPA: beta-N-acetylhexosaminidase [Gemmatimonadaceae bacterium]|nr:beta-N-acetylhexosaminidase [Gemmatimonadaceae bacterium]
MTSHLRLSALLAAAVGAACMAAPRPSMPELPAVSVAGAPAHQIIPAPATVQLTNGRFTIDSGFAIYIDQAATAEVEGVARYLAAMLWPFAQSEPRRAAPSQTLPRGSFRLVLGTGSSVEAESYDLAITPELVTIAAREPAGLFYGVQTVRQLLPAAVESRAAIQRRLALPTGRITDAPRFAWRGAMLDVSRHFLSPADVKRFIDHMTLYKLNRLHLHLADDQGWRIEIRSWPNLTRHGGSTEVGGGAGGFYTQAEFADIVAYARSRYIAIVPEIDMPGHTNAALASYPELNCDGVAPPLYTGIRVGFSTLCVERDTVYRFVSDVVREIGAMVPTPWFHIGGDEVEKLTDAQYRAFVERAQAIVRSHGKRMIGWGEIAPAALHPETIVQHWRSDSSHLHAARGGSIILSPSPRAYLDMKYDSATVLGLAWAGLISVRHAYDWDPAMLIPNVSERSILGVEGPLWSETLETIQDFEYMAFPRLAALAEIGWSPQGARQWESFAARLGAHGPRMAAMGINFYRSPEIRWGW